MLAFMAGMTAMGFATAALFFLRFWRRTGDMLFAIFAVSFLLFALNQALSILAISDREEQGWVFLLRLIGFALLLVAILHKHFYARPR
jgi:hypothetical protein